MHVAIVKISSLGDILQTAPAVLFIKKSEAKPKITWIVDERFKPLLEALEIADDVISFKGSLLKKGLFSFIAAINDLKDQLRGRKFDCVYDFQGNTKSALVTFMIDSKEKVGFSRSSVTESLNLIVTTKKIDVDISLPIAKQYLQLAGGLNLPYAPTVLQNRNQIMICPGSNWENKKLSFDQLRKFVLLVKNRYKENLIFIGGSKKELEELCTLEKNLPFKVDIKGPLAWKDWIEELNHVKIVVSADSCALHLARFYQVPTVSYFGPSSAKIYSPSSYFNESIQGACPYGVSFIKRCPKLRKCSTGACLKEINAESLFDQFCNLYERILEKST